MVKQIRKSYKKLNEIISVLYRKLNNKKSISGGSIMLIMVWDCNHTTYL